MDMTTSTPRSTIDVTEVTASSCLDECCSLLNATREHHSEVGRFDWLYLRNPDGPAIVWLLRESENGAAVGFTAALPRRMSVQGRERICWIGSDFSVLPKYRTLGLAVKLRRAAKDGIDAGRADFLYAHPNERMAVIHARVGHHPTGRMIRLARPLRVGTLVSDRVSSRAAGRIAGAVLDPVVRWGDGASWSRRRFEFEHLATASFDARVDGLFDREGRQSETIMGVRDATYLNWRYGANPCARSEVVLASKGNELCGYAIFVRDSDCLSIKDVFPCHRPEVVAGLLEEVRRIGYRTELQSVTMTLLDSNPMVAVLRSQGFRLRPESTEMYTYSRSDREWAPVVANPDLWQLTVGDRDV